jgi:predicted GNAT family acetyltransferase
MMNVDAKSLEVKNNTDAERFEVQLGDQIGLIKYRKSGKDYLLVHTEVPPEYEGQGIADRLAHVALETIKAEGARIVPICPFIQSYLRRHKEYASLVDERR